MKITAIKQQVKRHDRYSIYVDDAYAFSLSENDLISFGLHKDQEVTEGEMAQYRQDSLIGKAYDRCIRYLALRQRSQWEITDYLKRKNYDEEIIKAVLAKLEKLELVDDNKFARAWVESRTLVKPRSKRQLYGELLKKHIAQELIDEILSEIDEAQELGQLKDLVERKSKQSQYQDPQKLMAFLARQGYSYDLIKQALSDTK